MSELKKLQTQIKKLTTTRNSLVEKQKSIETQLTECNSSIRELRKQIQLSTRKIVVSEHAILRYLERVDGVDIDQIRESILTEELKKYSDQFTSGKFPFNKHNRAIIKDNVVVTIE